MSKKSVPARPGRRPSYPLPQDYVVMIEAVLLQALQGNPPLQQGIAALSRKLGLKGPYSVRLKATFEPVPEQPENPT